ncbi:MAG: hypothetical protein U1F36_01960 [Planctomycetota bacterium]
MKNRLEKALLLAVLACLPACATSHLVRWSRSEPSIYDQPAAEKSVYVRAGGTVLAFPVVLAWDIVTFPFQWFWDVYPYGDQNQPDEAGGR